MSSARIPPSYFNLFPIIAVLLHFLMPIKILIPPPFTYLGIILIVLGVTLNIWSVRILRDHQTTTEFNRDPSYLVMSGPFRLSRNPIYLSGVILLTGIAIFLGSLITFVFPILLLLILEIIYIPSEEEILENTFSDEYRSYKQKVRRWL
jgi:protein-S-isoprenylcysteine O-methyltransferase Ste14